MTKIKIRIVAYNGYGNKNKIYCRGRVLEDQNIAVSKKDSIIKTLINSYKRVETDEVPFQPIKVKFADIEKEIKTNNEGYYLLEEKLTNYKASKHFESIEISIEKENYQENWSISPINKKGKILFPSENAQFGIISDIDDTILKTDVLSTLKWRIFYNTLFIKAANRMPIKNASLWYRKLKGKDKKNQNPFFYVSNSPWNLYTYLQDFLRINEFPRGVVLLRDYGMATKDELEIYNKHKINEIEKVLNTYTYLPFVLIGDGGERDAHIYLKLKKKYPKQIKAIFIHRLGDKNHQAIIEKLAKGHEKYFFFVRNANDAIEISKKIGLI